MDDRPSRRQGIAYDAKEKAKNFKMMDILFPSNFNSQVIRSQHTSAIPKIKPGGCDTKTVPQHSRTYFDSPVSFITTAVSARPPSDVHYDDTWHDLPATGAARLDRPLSLSISKKTGSSLCPAAVCTSCSLKIVRSLQRRPAVGHSRRWRKESDTQEPRHDTTHTRETLHATSDLFLLGPGLLRLGLRSRRLRRLRGGVGEPAVIAI